VHILAVDGIVIGRLPEEEEKKTNCFYRLGLRLL
jgi:hypothetical protein